MTTAGWIFMLASVLSVTILMVWCFAKVLTAPQAPCASLLCPNAACGAPVAPGAARCGRCGHDLPPSRT